MQTLECFIYCDRAVVVSHCIAPQCPHKRSFSILPLHFLTSLCLSFGVSVHLLISLSPPLPHFCHPFFFLFSLSFSFLFGSLFSVLINVLWPIMAVTQRAAPVICSVSAVRLAEAPRLVNWAALPFHRDQKPLIEFMQPLLFLNSHFVRGMQSFDLNYISV